LLQCSLAYAEDSCGSRNAIAKIVALHGSVTVNHAPARLYMFVCANGLVRTGENSRAAVRLIEADTLLRLNAGTELQVRSPPEDRFLVKLIQGVVHFFSRVRQSFDVETPFVNAGIEGTEFLVSVEPDRTFVSVFEGTVVAENERGRKVLQSDQSAVALAGEAPEIRIVVRPRDAVQWALYYPPVLLEEADPTSSNAIIRASRLLAAGQVNQARAELDQLPETGEVNALRAVIAVAQNDKEAALSFAKQAVELSPQSAAAKIALSYAYQAGFELDKARKTLLRAVDEQPKDALAWARLSELQLSLGFLDDALKSADKAASLAPNLGRTNSIRGFALLTQIKTERAREAFEKAIALESEDPLPRLGLGLAKIREGDLEEGRREIEIAAALDPNNSLIRSYLGKAYFEEKRAPLDAVQFAIAKELDPADPTPWFYDAIAKQTESRPVEALNDLQKSIELNDNRAVYRSRLLLDQDVAVRATSVARIYDDLGFDQVALVEASKSLSIDPANHSAHRFLSDTYARLPRHEIARVSELLQAQLLQPININPVQPSLAVTDLNIVAGAGPADAAFNEFTPLFERNRPQVDMAAIVGNQDTLADEVVLSGLQNRLSYSIGQFHYETDGFRKNNDLKHDIYNVFGQVALTPKFNLQAEFRRRESDLGDRRQQFSGVFSERKRLDLRQDTARLGARFAPSNKSDFVTSMITSDLEAEEPRERGGRIDRSDDEGYQAETQYLFRALHYNITAGIGRSKVDSKENSPETDQDNGYVYSNLVFPENLTWSIGFGYDSYKQGALDLDEFNPKLGLQWDISKHFHLRLARFETLKRRLVVDQTIEPTQVAGFNQHFDDFNGTRAKQYGIGLDARLTRTFYGGMEASRRDLKVPTPTRAGDAFDFDKEREELYSAYLYWTPHSRWAVRGEYRLEKLQANKRSPSKVKTTSVPLAVRYFAPSGFFSELSATYVRQAVDQVSTDSEDSMLFDTALGYRLRKRRGIISLEARNLLDKEVRFQDMSFRTPPQRAANPRFIPDRTLLARITLSF
jgi:tetratricopeptide (TPR) repeat protein